VTLGGSEKRKVRVFFFITNLSSENAHDRLVSIDSLFFKMTLKVHLAASLSEIDIPINSASRRANLASGKIPPQRSFKREPVIPFT